MNSDKKSFDFSLNDDDEDETENYTKDISSFYSKSVTPVKKILVKNSEPPSFSKNDEKFEEKIY